MVGRLRAAVLLVAVLMAAGAGWGPAPQDALAAAPLLDVPASIIRGTATGLACPEPRRCSGFLAGADGTALDVDLVLPAADRYPLVVNVHGWASDKGTGAAGAAYPGDQFMTDRGYAVLRYSARGFGKSWGQADLGRPDHEIADLRALVSAVVDDPRVNVIPDKVAVIGASYGGHHAWMMAATSPTWKTPGNRTVRLAAVVPIWGWTDLASALLPNGSEQDPWAPVGTPKLSYLMLLNTLGVRADPERLYPNYSPELVALLTRALAGEPFQLGEARDPIVNQLRSYMQSRSAADTDWVDRARRDRSSWVPVLAVQGWTDDLFPSTEATRMVQKLEAVSRDYPVKLYLGDAGHPRSVTSPQEIDRIFAMMSDWLAYWLKGEGPRPAFDVTSAVTTPGPFDPSASVTVPNVAGLTTGTVTTEFGGPLILVNQPVQLGGVPADPVLKALPGIGLVVSDIPPAPGDLGGALAVRSVDELTGGKGFWYQGRAKVRFTGTVLGADVQYDVRLWDRDPAGRTILVDRGTRKFVGAPGRVALEVDLAGNSWRFLPGHQVVMEVTNVDLPFLRPNTLPSSTIVDHVTLDLPTYDGSTAVAATPSPASAAADRAEGGSGSTQAPPASPPASPPAPVRPAGTAPPAAGGGPAPSGPSPTVLARQVEAPPGSEKGRPLLVMAIAAPFLLAIAVAVARQGKGA